MLRQLQYALLPQGKGIRCPYGYMQGGASISTKLHDLFMDTEEAAILVRYGKSPQQEFYVAKESLACWQYKPATPRIDSVTNQTPSNEADPKKRGPGRPRKVN
jgi:hypothetical protein